MVEKLLRSCPDINKIYILIRPKKGLNFEERFDVLLKSKLFSFAGVTTFRRSFFLRTNVFVSNPLSAVDVGVEGSLNIEKEILILFYERMIFNRQPCPSNVLLTFNFIFFVNVVTVWTEFGGDSSVFSAGCGITYGNSAEEIYE